jgi:DNA polymerase I
MTTRPMLYLIDGHAVAYRQFFGLPVAGFSTKSGEPTNATFGFTRILLDLLQKTKPKYLAVTLDKGLSGREDIFPEYKGTRERMPDELRVQMDRIRQVVHAFNIPLLELEGYEADDVIGTIATQATEQDVDVRVITGDRDLLQLLNDHVTVQLPSHKGNQPEIYDTARFIEKYGVRPDQWIDMKALMGDSSDNIPGVKGIGAKTATKFLNQFETLDGVYENIDSIKGANNKKMTEGRESAYMSQKLVTIICDVPVTLDLEACVAHDYDSNTVIELLRELEFRGFINRLIEDTTPVQTDMFSMLSDDDDFAPPAEVDTGVETIIIQDEAGLNALIETLNKAKDITWDVETTGVDQMRVELVGIALAVDGETGYYVPVGHNTGTQLPLQQVVDALRPPLTNPDIAKYAHNAAYDMVVMSRYGIDVTPVNFDTMVGEWLRDPISKHLGLKNLAMHELGVYMTPIEELIGKGKKQITMREVPINQSAPYAAADAVMTHRLAGILRDDLANKKFLGLYDTLEMPVVPVIAAMEQAGVALDVAFLSDMSKRLSDDLKELEQNIYDLSAGYGEFNINSPKQLNDVLFVKLNLPVAGLKKTTHGFSTNVVTLEKLKADTGHPIVTQILDYRELTKLKGTYVDALPELINPHTGRVHTSYNQTGTSTGRLSSTNPNLQNIPIRTEIGREVRRAFVAPKGKVLLAVDYSQIELRVLAHISQDATLLNAFAEGQDIHSATAAVIHGVSLDEVTYEQRSFAKTINFGLLYGMGAFRLARDSDLTLAEADAFIKTYFERMPGVGKYIDDTKRQATNDGYVETLFGRRRSFPNLQRGQYANKQAIQGEQRAAVNMPIQGTAADIMKRAMIDLYVELGQSKLDALMILQVHDEIVLEVPENELDETRDLVVRVLEDAYQMDAVLKANAEAGPNWRDMVSVKSK